MTRRSAALITATLLTASLAACGGDQEQVSSSSSTSPAAPSSAASASAEPAPSIEASSAPFAGDLEPDVEEPIGGPLSVTSVRVASQDGFDRVVFELDGNEAGEPGWRVEYTDAPSSQGSGDSVDVTGGATLALLITGVGYPFDTGVDEVSGDPTLPAGLGVVEDVVLGAVFEGQYEAFIGVSTERPFTVTRLADPARVVVDIAHN